MTARAAFREADVSRAIRAARKAGLRVTGIAPDGTVLIGDAETNSTAPASEDKLEAARWSGAEP